MVFCLFGSGLNSFHIQFMVLTNDVDLNNVWVEVVDRIKDLCVQIPCSHLMLETFWCYLGVTF